jgi:hypothetical protein
VANLLFDRVRFVVELYQAAGADGARGTHILAGETMEIGQRPEDGSDVDVCIDLAVVPGEERMVG